MSVRRTICAEAWSRFSSATSCRREGMGNSATRMGVGFAGDLGANCTDGSAVTLAVSSVVFVSRAPEIGAGSRLTKSEARTSKVIGIQTLLRNRASLGVGWTWLAVRSDTCEIGTILRDLEFYGTGRPLSCSIRGLIQRQIDQKSPLFRCIEESDGNGTEMECAERVS
jgi:hypothetical protein